MSVPARLSCPGHRPAVHLARRASHGSEGLSSACRDDRNSPLSTERQDHSYIPHSECYPAAPESLAACCDLGSGIRICRRLDPLLLPASPACLFVVVQEVFGPAHLLWRQATRCLLSSQMCLPPAFVKFAQ